MTKNLELKFAEQLYKTLIAQRSKTDKTVLEFETFLTNNYGHEGFSMIQKSKPPAIIVSTSARQQKQKTFKTFQHPNSKKRIVPPGDLVAAGEIVPPGDLVATGEIVPPDDLVAAGEIVPPGDLVAAGEIVPPGDLVAAGEIVPKKNDQSQLIEEKQAVVDDMDNLVSEMKQCKKDGMRPAAFAKKFETSVYKVLIKNYNEVDAYQLSNTQAAKKLLEFL